MVENNRNLEEKVKKDGKEDNSSSSENAKSNDSKKENQSYNKRVVLQEGVMEIDSDDQLKEVRLKRILVTQLVMSQHSQDNVVEKVLMAVMKLVQG